ncbi:uncharacterized protein J7T54_008548 [Emericellopsis cladophorae]|uniref:Uncharacterized protein n=1 Tax=Emericellopsis cladophorae TaxID=2686198 RepID=A0A9P9Y0C5_9HYPO|nr:uncharacterized protein J7T54_008548 [Emericellopsis cladophorae]KAI6780629.1 hypothetical protein J7T54_008548 [Emericellopsis cladophorae]
MASASKQLEQATFPKRLELGSRGSVVTLVQSWLLRLGAAAIPASEIAERRFGVGTFKAVRNFAGTGVVDDATAVAMAEKVDGLDPESTTTQTLTGKVVYLDGSPGKGLSIRLSQVNIHQDVPGALSSAVADDEGFYLLKYRLKKGHLAFFALQVDDKGNVLFSTPPEGAISPSDIPVLVQDIKLGVKQKSTDLFTRLQTAISAIRRGGGLANSKAPPFSHLDPLNKRRELAIVSQLAASDFSADEVSSYMVANSLSEVAEQDGMPIPPAFFYALIHGETYEKAVEAKPRNAAGAIRPTTIAISPRSILQKLRMADGETLELCVKLAIDSNFILASITQLLADIIESFTLQRPGLEMIEEDVEGFWGVMRELFKVPNGEDKTRAESLLDILQEENLVGQMFSPKGWTQRIITQVLGVQGQGDNSQRNEPTPSTPMPKILSPSASFQKALREDLDRSENDSKRRISAFGRPADKILNVSETEKTGWAQRAVKTLLSKPHSTDHGITEIEARKLLDFLSSNSKFDLAHSKVEHFLAQEPGGPQATRTGSTINDTETEQVLRKMQRVFRLAPSYEQSMGLVNIGVRSAVDANSMGKARLRKLLSSDPVFTSADVEQIANRAADVVLAVSLLMAEMRTLSSALSIPGLSTRVPEGVLREAATHMPNLKSLFELGDTCSCSDCMTVYSPAAYIVEVFEFLRHRRVLVGKEEVDFTDSIIQSRRDLAFLDLNCDNTNTTMPQIDIVCELLEDLLDFQALSSHAVFSIPLDVFEEKPMLAALSSHLGLDFTESTTSINFTSTSSPDTAVVRHQHHVFLVFRTEFSVGLVVRTKQTFGTSAERAAFPLHVNHQAYERLAESPLLLGLPFHIDNAEGRLYLNKLDVSRARLIRLLTPVSESFSHSSSYLVEAFDMSELDLQLITTPSANPIPHWRTATLHDPINDLRNVQSFLDRTQLTYNHLIIMLRARDWLNPELNGILIHHQDESCSLDKKDLVNLDNQSLDRVHRFLRLWKALGMNEKQGWTISVIDRAIAMPSIGNGSLDITLLAHLATTNRLLSWLPKDGHVSSVQDCLDWFGPLVTHANDPSIRSYESLFLSQLPNLSPPPGFPRRPQEQSDLKLVDFADHLSGSLSISYDDMATIVGFVHKPEDLQPATYEAISHAYSVYSICQTLPISPSEFVSLSMLLGIDPTSSPEGALVFAKSLAAIRTSLFSIDDITHLLVAEAPHQHITDSQLVDYFALLKSTYQSLISNTPIFDDSTGLVEKQEATLAALLANMEFFQPEIDSLTRLIAGELLEETRAILGDDKVEVIIGKPRQALILAALDERLAFSGDQSDEESLDHFISSWFDVISDFALENSKETALLSLIKTWFGLQGEQTLAVLKHVKRVQPLSGDLNSESDGTCALRLLHKISVVVSSLDITPSNLEWLLQFGPALGWGDLAAFPVAAGDMTMAFEKWDTFRRGYSTLVSSSMAPVVDAQNPGTTLSVQTFFESVLQDKELSNGIGSSLDYLSKLTKWGSLTDLEGVANQMQLDVGNLTSPLVLTRLEETFQLLRPLPSVSLGIRLVKRGNLSCSDVLSLQRALKQKYASGDWLQVLRSIQDPLRIRKRDALVEFSLRTGVFHHSFTHARQISAILGIDIEVGTEIQVSRIIEAHLALQTFVQRLQMGQFLAFAPNGDPAMHSLLEVRLIQDDAWEQWNWMSQYRLWEANRKVFLYPENWIEPELRDDKSNQFKRFEEKLSSGDVSDELATEAGEQLVSDIANISKPDIVSVFYEAESKSTHVFARLGAGAGSIFHRRLFEERYWTPWELVDVPSISSGSFLAFVRNSRLTVAFTQTDIEMDPLQAGVSGDGETGKLRKRFAINLGISEKDPRTGKWSAERMSKRSVYCPPGGAFVTFERLDIDDLLVLNYWNVGSNFGECISVRMPIFDSTTSMPHTGKFYLSEFALAGSESLPERQAHEYYTTAKDFLPRPDVKRAEYLDQIFTLSETQATNETEPLTIDSFGTSGPHEVGASTTAFNKTHGSFSVIMSPQISKLDLLVWSNQFRHRQTGFEGGAADGLWRLPTGSMVPFFYKDNSGRTFVLVPGFVYRDEGNPDFSVQPFRTTTDVYEFLRRALQLAEKYISRHRQDELSSFDDIRSLVQDDPEYNKFLLPEWTDVYGFRHDGGAINIVQFKMASVYHPLMTQLSEQMVFGGLERVLSRSSQLMSTEFNFDAEFRPSFRTVGSLPAEAINFGPLDAYSSYNWELFFHGPFMAACKLSSNQKFNEAMRWFHFIFNPKGDSVDAAAEDGIPAPQSSYWMTKPFYQTSVSDYAEQLISNILYSTAEDPQGAELADRIVQSIRTWRENPFNPHAIARTRPVAFQIAIVLRYIRNLVDWGDHLFRQLTRETLAQATLLYSAADGLLGRKPQEVEPVLKPATRSLYTLYGTIGLFGNAVVDFENAIPNLGDISSNRPDAPDPLLPTYFGIPPNDSMLQCWDLVADRLFKIRNSLDINGNFISLPLTSPPIDPGALVRRLAAGSSVQAAIVSLSVPLSRNRFATIAEMAMSLTGQVVSLGSTLLSVMEKKDGEALARLRAGLEKDVLNAVKASKANTIKAIGGVGETGEKKVNGEIQSLEFAKVVAEDRAAYYRNLKYTNSREEKEISNRRGVLAIHALSEGLHLWHSFVAGWRLPKATMGGQGFSSPVVELQFDPVADKKDITAAAIGTANHQATIATSAATLNALFAGFDRRKEGWDFEKAQAEAETNRLTNEIATAKLRSEAAKLDLVAHETAMVKLAEEDHMMRSKHTNQELYAWGINQITKVYTDTYDLALRMARQAEMAFVYELATGHRVGVGSFVKPSYWDSLKSGLLAGEQLQFDIGRMKTAYLDNKVREYELETNISLQEINPMALLSLRQSGQCIFDVPEDILDIDTPGHYLRRNRVVRLSLPVEGGQALPISAKLTLLAHRYRASSASGSGYVENPPGNDPRFKYGSGQPSHTIVTSTNTLDGGFFPGLSEVYRHGATDVLYLPFEMTGVVGTYHIELPPVQRFDYATITDVILHLMYTAREGGAPLRNAVTKLQEDRLNKLARVSQQNGLQAAFNMSLHAPTAWLSLQTAPSVTATVPSTVIPFWARAGGFLSQVKKITWYAEIKPGAQLPSSIELQLRGTEVVSLSMERGGKSGRLYSGMSHASDVPLDTAIEISLNGGMNATELGLGGLGAVLEFEVSKQGNT